jgi:hypothetical protein
MGVLFGCPGGLIFLRDEDLEARRTLRCRIHRLVGKDHRSARRDDFLCLGQEVGRQLAFLRHLEQALARFVFVRGSGHFRPPEMSLWIRPTQGAENVVIQRRKCLRIWNPGPADLDAVAIHRASYPRC